MTEIKQKFCEECGKTSPIEVKYCKFCGIEFPVIDHPDYVSANAPTQSNQVQGQFPDQQIQPGQPTYPPHFPPQQTQSQGFTQPHTKGFYMRKPPRVWEGGGVVKASVAFFSNPTETTPGLIEDPQAPNSIWIIFLTALSAAFAQYFTYLKTNFTELNGDDDEFFKMYTTAEEIESFALESAVAIFFLLFGFWFVLSWLLALTIKNGLPQDSHLLNAPSRSMRQLSGFLYIPTMFRNVAKIILLQFEGDREASLKEGELFGNSTPEITYLTEFSNQYILILFIVTIIMAAITAFTLYKSIKHGLHHRGSTPAMIAIVIVFYSVFFRIP